MNTASNTRDIKKKTPPASPSKKRPLSFLRIKVKFGKTPTAKRLKLSMPISPGEEITTFGPIHNRRINRYFLIKAHRFINKDGREDFSVLKDYEFEEDIMRISRQKYEHFQKTAFKRCLNLLEARMLPFIKKNSRFHIFQAKLYTKLGQPGKAVKIYESVLELVKKAKYEEKKKKEIATILKKRVFKYRLLAAGSLRPRRISKDEKYLPYELLEMATYGAPLTKQLLEKLHKHKSPFINLLTALNALEVIQNPDLKVLVFHNEEELGFNYKDQGEFNKKNTIFSRPDIDTFTHELIHKILDRIFWEQEKPFEKNLEALLDAFAGCIRNFMKEIMHKGKMDDEKVDSIEDIKKYVQEDDYYFEILEDLYDLEDKKAQYYLNRLKGLAQALDYEKNEQGEEIIVRFVAAIAEHPEVEADPIFRPLKKWLEKHIKVRMQEVFDNHPTKKFFQMG